MEFYYKPSINISRRLVYRKKMIAFTLCVSYLLFKFISIPVIKLNADIHLDISSKNTAVREHQFIIFYYFCFVFYVFGQDGNNCHVDNA